jgi:hypothetical protein
MKTISTVIKQLDICIKELEVGLLIISEECQKLDDEIQKTESESSLKKNSFTKGEEMSLYILPNELLASRITFSVKGFFMVYRQGLDSVFNGLKIAEKQLLKNPKVEMPNGSGNGKIGIWFKKYFKGDIEFISDFDTSFKRVELILMKGYVIRNAMKRYADFKVVKLLDTPLFFSVQIEESLEKSTIGAHLHRIWEGEKSLKQEQVIFELTELENYINTLNEFKTKFSNLESK